MRYNRGIIDLFPSIYGTLKAATFFSTTLSGFEDDAGRFKVFKRNEAPSDHLPFIRVEIDPGDEHQHTDWSAPYVIFSIHGSDTQWATLYVIAEEIKKIFMATECFAPVNGADPVQYALIGSPIFDEGKNQVTEHVVVSVALRFGITE